MTAIVVFNVALGLLFAPRRTVTALRETTTSGGSLFAHERPYDSLLELTVGELRELLHLPRAGIATRARGLHAHAPRPAP